MTSTQAKPGATQEATTFDSLNPATGEVVATFPVQTRPMCGPPSIGRAAQRPGGASSATTDAERACAPGARCSSSAVTNSPSLIHRENGKPVDDALGEVILAVEHVSWAAANAAKVLGRRRVAPGMLAMNHTASAEYVPYGVVGVIGPWNYPVHTPMGSITYALAAGNAVVFKPSEYTPAIGKWLVDAFAEVVPEAAGPRS